MTNQAYISNGQVYVENDTPKLHLKGSEASAVDVSIRENAGKVDIYNEVTGAILRTLYPERFIITRPHYPVLPGAVTAELAATDWKEPFFIVPTAGVWVVEEVGVIPQVAFGQATNYAILTAVNKGSVDGSGVTAISASYSANAALTIFKKYSFGAIAAPNLAAGDVINIEKTHAGTGQIVSNCLFYMILSRTA